MIFNKINICELYRYFNILLVKIYDKDYFELLFFKA